MRCIEFIPGYSILSGSDTFPLTVLALYAYQKSHKTAPREKPRYQYYQGQNNIREPINRKSAYNIKFNSYICILTLFGYLLFAGSKVV